MNDSVVSILTADHAALLAEENARLECRIQELEAEVEHWKALWRQNLENASEAMAERDAALAEVERQKALVVAARVDVSAANHALAAEQSKNRRRGW